MPIPLLAAAAPFAPIIGAGIDALTSNIQANNARNTAYDLADKQHQYAVEDWNRNNEYNSPAAQMGRYKTAGLNPNLIYGQMSNAPAIKSPDISFPGQAAPTSFGHAAAATSSNILTSQMNAQQIEQSKSQSALLDATTFTKIKEGQYYDAMAQAQLNNMGANTANTQQNTLTSKSLLGNQIQHGQLINDQTRMQTQKIIQETSNLFNDNDRARLRNTADVAKTWQDITTQKLNNTKNPYEINLLKTAANSNIIKQMLDSIETKQKTYDLNKLKSIQPTSHDPFWQRVLGGIPEGPIKYYK